jgi:hypothetical protein
MSPPKYFELLDGYARYHPQGEVSLRQAVEWIGVAIAFAREQNIERLFVDATAPVSRRRRRPSGSISASGSPANRKGASESRSF